MVALVSVLGAEGEPVEEVPVRPVGVERGPDGPCRVWEGRLSSGACVRLVVPLPLAVDEALPLAPLTERQVEVLRFVAEGYTDADIARALRVGWGTVRTHVQHIRERLLARSRAEAVARALVLGLFD